jgi:alanyl-tRNA synthetase
MLLRGVEKTKGATRIEFVCGARAVARARADFDAMSAIGHTLSASIDQAPQLLEVQSRTLRDAESRLKKMDVELATFRARALWDAAAPDSGGVRRVVQQLEAGSVDSLRSVALQFAALPKAVFVAVSQQPPSILVASSADSGVDAGRVLKDALTAAGGRGGGSARLAQGSAPTADALRAVVAAFLVLPAF